MLFGSGEREEGFVPVSMLSMNGYRDRWAKTCVLGLAVLDRLRQSLRRIPSVFGPNPE
ncbi:hypothetical protein L195_g039094 [Trifolium pratense]|uniref:Uncharacterized protein n=1 Tax=Trifolium pratense TaxID=57577 RepID=A0A2K3LWZ1_TRIPR|nr:hypothetical protein L195_g039094 [Trifolium pratense]